MRFVEVGKSAIGFRLSQEPLSLVKKCNVLENYTEQQKKIYRMYLRVFQLFLANLGALISNLKPDFFYHV